MQALAFLAPAEYIEALNIQADTTNLPNVGVDWNTAFPLLQLNLAEATELMASKLNIM